MAQFQTPVDSIYALVDPGTVQKVGVALGEPSLATAATLGFCWIGRCAGTPTGVPSPIPTGMAALLYDSTGGKIWVYDQISASWKGVAVA